MPSKDQMRFGALLRRRFRYVRIDGANHWLQLTAPEKLNLLLLRLLLWARRHR
jgi:pimeloyl-ACP methyl ester carboxylesterase